MLKFFTEDSKLVEGQVLLIEKGLIDMSDILPIYNLREVVQSVLSKRGNMVDKADMDNMEGGD